MRSTDFDLSTMTPARRRIPTPKPDKAEAEDAVRTLLRYIGVAYLPGNRVVGISKPARVVQAHAKRLQIQERMTAEIADTIERALHPTRCTQECRRDAQGGTSTVLSSA
jgi:GTP cyclohydrolase I